MAMVLKVAEVFDPKNPDKEVFLSIPEKMTSGEAKNSVDRALKKLKKSTPASVEELMEFLYPKGFRVVDVFLATTE